MVGQWVSKCVGKQVKAHGVGLGLGALAPMRLPLRDHLVRVRVRVRVRVKARLKVRVGVRVRVRFRVRFRVRVSARVRGQGYRDVVDDLVADPRAVVHGPLARQPAARTGHPIKGRCAATGVIPRV
eukprot:scaffold39621_cov46-Phaeocystis_antarctica.AAC.2